MSITEANKVFHLSEPNECLELERRLEEMSQHQPNDPHSNTLMLLASTAGKKHIAVFLIKRKPPPTGMEFFKEWMDLVIPTWFHH